MATEPKLTTFVDYSILPLRIKEALQIVNDKLDLFYHYYFLGGSYRFGWETKDSDIDIMLYAQTVLSTHYDKEELELADISALIEHLGAVIVNNNPLNYPGSLLLETEYFGIKIQFSVITDKREFDVLLREHKRVSDFMYKYPWLCNLVRQMFTPGSRRYRAVLKLVKEEGV